MNEEYYTARICLNGHIISSYEEIGKLKNQFCDKCGEKTISICPSCNTGIRGSEKSEKDVLILLPYVLPKHCFNCGEPFPWTKRAIKAAIDLTDELENLTSEEKIKLKETFPDLIKESANIKVAELRFKRLVSKAGDNALEMFKDILSGVLSAGVSKVLFGA